MTAGSTPLVNLVISILCFLEGIALIWFPSLLISIMVADGSQIQLDNFHLMFCGVIAGLKFFTSAVFCTLDGREKQTKAIVIGALIYILLSVRTHYKVCIFPWPITSFSCSVPNTIRGCAYLFALSILYPTIGHAIFRPRPVYTSTIHIFIHTELHEC